MPNIVLKYFDCRGAAEAIRMAFHYGGIEFTDERVALPVDGNTEWPELKPSKFLNSDLPS